ncbi:MAG TPA: MFS transporter [Solirubrobacteraceae bacterium]|nr:MFS transporter [Solirubrobacteraceae bacterium]
MSLWPATVERRLVLVISAVVFVDTMFYAVIAPLLPTLARELQLSKLSAGVMTASYPVGTLLGSLPGGVVAARVGPKPTVAAGLALLAGSTVAFALLHDAVSLDCARFVEGVGGAFSWAGGLAWIVAETPSERRGALIGQALGAAIGGALFGPVIGTLANAIGRRAAFSVVVVIALLLIAATRRLPSSHVRSAQGLRTLLPALGGAGVTLAMWLVALPAVAAGALDVLAPLRLHRFGASVAAVGATFLLAAVAEGTVSPVAGRLSDLRGRLLPLRLGLAAAGALLLCFSLPGGPLVLAIVVVAIAGALGGFWAPAMALLSDAAERQGLDYGLAAALMNLAWASGQIIGSGAGGAIANVAGDGAAMTIVAALCVGTLLLLKGSLLPASAPQGRVPASP